MCKQRIGEVQKVFIMVRKSARPLPVAQASAPPSIDWPPLRPLFPAALELDPTLPGQIVSVRNFWPAKLCKDYVSFLRTLPLTTTPGKPKRGDAVRVNDRFQIDDPAFAERLWSETGLKTLVLNGASEGNDSSLSETELRELWGGEVVGKHGLCSIMYIY